MENGCLPITSVTSFYNRQIFADWRKRVGIDEANRITKKATAHGTDFHEAVEVYMKIKEINWETSVLNQVHVSSCPTISGQDK